MMNILVLLFNFRYHAYIGVVIDICNAFVMEGALEGECIVSFLSETFKVGLIDPDFLNRVVHNAAMKKMVGRNSYRDERFIIEVTLPWNGKKGTIDNDHELYQIWQLCNEKKFTEIVFDMTIIPLNVTNVIKRKLFEDDIEYITIGPDAEP